MTGKCVIEYKGKCLLTKKKLDKIIDDHMTEKISDFAEQVFLALTSINEALDEINTEEDYEVSERLEEIQNSIDKIDKKFV